MLRRDAFEHLYRRYEKSLFNIALRWTWNEAEAIELVHDAFMCVWRRRLLVQTETAKAYLYRTLLNLAHKHARKRQNWQRVRQRLDTQLFHFSNAEQTIDHARVQEAIAQLPDQQRQVLLLCEYSDLSQNQIANLLEIPPGTVASRRHSAISRLKECLQ